MAFENLLITVKRQIGGIKVDGVITESTERTMRVTTNPVESGVNIADHVIQEPLRYSMTGVITDTPIGAAAFSQLAGSVVDAATGIFGESESSGATRSQQAYNELVALMNAKEIITVDTTLQKYEDLIFESIVVNADKNTANGIHFSASFVQAFIVKTSRQKVDAENIEGSEDKAALSSKSNSGFNGGSPATPAETSTIASSVGQ